MKIIYITIFFSINIFAANDLKLTEMRYLTNKTNVYNFLFQKHFELKNPDCHRQVFESRSPKIMIAMGCRLFKLRYGPSNLDPAKYMFIGTYECRNDEANSKEVEFTAHCNLK